MALVSAFTAMAVAVGAIVEPVAPAELAARLSAIAREAPTHFAPEVAAPAPGPFVPEPSAVTVVTRAIVGIARTGTVVVAERREEDRVAAFLARRHVVVLRTSDLVPDLPETSTVLRRCIAEGLPHITYATGPSRTSDIEKVLTIGVHGPGELLILLVSDEITHGN